MQGKKSLFIFRRDLRLFDNTALQAACRESQQVDCCFIFDPRQVEEHPYLSRPGLAFLCHSLTELAEELKSAGGRLNFYYAQADQVLQSILSRQEHQAVYINRDYTPFSIKRDEALQAVCKEHGVGLKAFHDLCLQPPGSVLTQKGTAFTVYTPFYRAAAQIAVPLPEKFMPGKFNKDLLPDGLPAIPEEVPQINSNSFLLQGGRKEGLELLSKAVLRRNYQEERDLPALPGNHLSPHFKFGTLSIREAYQAVCAHNPKDSVLIREFYWRDFFTQIGFHFPHVFAGNFQKKYANLDWRNDQSQFEAWCAGQTGFPIVDAGMRELVTSGFMHNRVRMITASFLVKDLQIDWRWGERFFARHLLDYDPAVNNGNWQWAASTGCDAQPYFRIFNPWLQQKKFDPECIYIKRWVPELQALTAKEIHKLSEQRPLFIKDYPDPVVDHSIERQAAEEMFLLAD